MSFSSTLVQVDLEGSKIFLFLLFDRFSEGTEEFFEVGDDESKELKNAL